MDIKSIINQNIAVHCDTIEKAKSFLKECESYGITWCNGDLLSNNEWYTYTKDTCYAIQTYGMEYSYREWYMSRGYDIKYYDGCEIDCEILKILITQNKKGNKITATMKTPDGKYIKHATAKCSPADEFDYEFGKNLALSRLFDLDTEKVISSIQTLQKKFNHPLYLVDIESRDVCGEVGQFTRLMDANCERLYVGDQVKIISSRYKTRTALICYSEKDKTFLSSVKDCALYDDGMGLEDGSHFFIVKEKSYVDIKLGDKIGNIEVVE